MRKVMLLLVAISLAGSYIILHQSLSKGEVVRVAVGTTLYSTGLVDELVERFESLNPGFRVTVIPLGTGASLEVASRGDVDVVIVHSPTLEWEYIKEGILVEGRIVAYNHFVLVGPEGDPAGVRGRDPLEALARVFKAGEDGRARFVSRGDMSGTHMREMMLWRLAGLNPRGKGWYVEAGLGMAETLLLASEMGAYTLADVGTWRTLEGRVHGMVVMVYGGELMVNVYTAYMVNPRVLDVNEDGARLFLEFLVSDEGQGIVAEFAPSFFPSLGKVKLLIERWEMLLKLGG